MPPQYREHKASQGLLEFVVSLNLKRRHLNESQRSMAAAKAATLCQGARTDRALIGRRLINSKSQAEAAKQLNVSVKSLKRAKKVRDSGTAELIDAVEAGGIAVSAAAKIAGKPEEEQKKILKRPTAAQARKLARETGRLVTGPSRAC